LRLTDQQIERYSRQIIQREIGGTGQTALLAARILVLGSGAACDTAVTYLAGAGIGTLDLVPAPLPAGDAALPYAPPRARNADVRCRTLGAAALSATDYDVVLALSDGQHASPALPGRPARGSVALRRTAAFGLEVALVPSRHGCTACLPWPEIARQGPFAAADVVDLASAGALAALAACRWVLALDRGDGPRVLALPGGDAVWVESPLQLRLSCPRGCPPTAQSL